MGESLLFHCQSLRSLVFYESQFLIIVLKFKWTKLLVLVFLIQSSLLTTTLRGNKIILISYMKIAIIYFRLNKSGGAQLQALFLARALMLKGHEIVVYTAELDTSQFDPSLLKGLDIRCVPLRASLVTRRSQNNLFVFIFSKFLYHIDYVRAAKKIAQVMDSDFDVINSHEVDSCRVGFFYKKRNKNVRHIWMMNSPLFSPFLSNAHVLNFIKFFYNSVYSNFIEKRFLTSVDLAVVLNSWDLVWAQKHGLQARIVRSGLDFQQYFSPVKKMFGIPPHLLTFAVFDWEHRRFEDIINAVKILRDQNIITAATILGSYYDEEIAHLRKYKQMLDNLIHRHHLERLVDLQIISKGFTADEISKAYVGSDIFIMPTYFPPPRRGYGWGLVVFEAMASGLPVVLCQTSGASEILSDGINAVFTKPMSPKDIARKIQFLIDDQRSAYRIAAAGQNFVKNNVSWDVYAEGILRAFQDSSARSIS